MDWDKINLKICRKLSEITFWVPKDCMVKNEKTQKVSHVNATELTTNVEMT